MQCDLVGQSLLEQMKAENEKLTAAGAGGEDNGKLEELLAAKQAELQVRPLWRALGAKTCARRPRVFSSRQGGVSLARHSTSRRAEGSLLRRRRSVPGGE